MPKFTQKQLEDSRRGSSDLFSFGFEGPKTSSPGGPPTSGGASRALHAGSPNRNAATSSSTDPSQESDHVQHSKGKRKLGSLDPVNKGPAVARGPLKPHQAGVFERMKAGMAHPSFASSRAKLGEIAREAAKARGMGDETSTEDVLREACGEYHPRQVLALDQLREGPLTPDEMRESGIEIFVPCKHYEGGMNYIHYYVFRVKQPALDMVDKWQREMGVGAALCGAVRNKVNGHDWDNNGPLRLSISGEGLPASAHKYAKRLQNPPSPARAREPRQVNGRVANDGPAWNVPAGMVLAGPKAIDTVGTETVVWKSGDPERSWREVHEAIGALVFLGGLVWSPESLGLNQKVGGTFNDDQRSLGGRYGVDEEVWNGERKPTAEEQRLMDKKQKDSSAAGKGTQGTQISSTGGRRGPGGKGENVDISSLRTSIGFFPRAYKKEDGTYAAPKGESEFFIYRIPGVNGGTATLGLSAYDSNGKVVTLSYPSDKTGKEIAKTVGITNRLYNGRLVTKAKDEIRRSRGNKVGAK